MDGEVHAAAAAGLQQVGQRYTRSRRQLVDVLAAAGRPLSIPEILTGGVDLPQSSVYRNLSVLESAGAVRRVLTDEASSRYELAEELTEHHHHLVCVGCGTVADYTMSPTLERSMERAIAAIAADTGFRPEGHRLDLVGRCATCR